LKTYRKHNTITGAVSGAALILLLAGWLVPTLVEALKNYTLAIALGCSGVAIVALLTYSVLFRKKSEEWIRNYFNFFYDKVYAYVFDHDEVTGFHGDLKMKLTEEEFKANKLYKDVYKIGSRYSVNFNYQGMDCALIDCAAQVRGAKALETAFVGKDLRTPNTYKGSGIYVYFKGNKRALPPTALGDIHIIEDNKRFTIWGEESERAYITHEMKEAFKQIETDKVLVDLAISIQEGRTHFLMGYEDSLMVIPMEKPFNPGPTKTFKANIHQVLDLATLFNK
jgi:hypothetical protein